MPVNEALGILAQIVIRIEGSLQDLKGDVLGHVPGLAFRRVEGDDAERVAVLGGQETAPSSSTASSACRWWRPASPSTRPTRRCRSTRQRHWRIGDGARPVFSSAPRRRHLALGLFPRTQRLDTTTPTGKLVFQVAGAFAELSGSMIWQRINAGLKRAVAQAHASVQLDGRKMRPHGLKPLGQDCFAEKPEEQAGNAFGQAVDADKEDSLELHALDVLHIENAHLACVTHDEASFVAHDRDVAFTQERLRRGKQRIDPVVTIDEDGNRSRFQRLPRHGCGFTNIVGPISKGCLGRTLPRQARPLARSRSSRRAIWLLRDVANASKHVSLDRPSTSMTHAADVARHGGAFSRGFSSGFDVTRARKSILRNVQPHCSIVGQRF